MFDKFANHRMSHYIQFNIDTFEETIYEVFRNDKTKVTIAIRLEKDGTGTWQPNLVEISQDVSLNTLKTEHGHNIFGNVILRKSSLLSGKNITVEEVEKILNDFLNQCFYST